APRIIDYLCQACQEHFAEVKRMLQETHVDYVINPNMVRGLDYYGRTTFEWTTNRLGSQNAVAAGGRYDGLVKELGGPAVAGVGFALGIERLVLLLGLNDENRLNRPGLYVAWMGKAAADWAFNLAHALRDKGITVEMDGEEKSLKSQMRRADKLKARYVFIIGDDELKKGKGILRHMGSKEQSEVSLKTAAAELPGKLPA
ncbi:MAG: histidine--tRNA ligase, partial [Deltaproteobacteria bacterium]|nr:histidine--tRNA ligase [Deltaproteobacteria bacterium]